MKKWYSIGLLLLVLVLAASLLVACGSKDETATTAADDTATTVAADTATTAGATAADVKPMPTTLGTELGLYGEDQGNNVVKVTDVPAPGLQFPISTEGDFAMKIEAIGADGSVLGTISTTTGLVDYTEFAADAVSLLFTTVDGTQYSYAIPGK